MSGILPEKQILAEKQIIDQLINGTTHYSKSTLDLIQNTYDSTTKIAVNGAISSGARIAGAAASPGTLGASVAAGISGVAFAGAVFAAAIGALYAVSSVYQLQKSEEEWFEEIASQADRAVQNIALECIKDEFRLEKNIKSITETDNNLTKYRKHEAFLSWIKLENLRILANETNDPEALKQKQRYNSRIQEQIKPEALSNGRFEKEMRTFCAANALLARIKSKKNMEFSDFKDPSLDLAGEFSKSKPDRFSSWTSFDAWTEWSFGTDESKKQKSFEPQMQNLLKPGYKFSDIKKKYYGAYKAATYANCRRIEKIDGILIENYIYTAFENLLIKALLPAGKTTFDELKTDEEKEELANKRKTFIGLFYKYRYYGAECEFDANEFFRMKLFDKFYCAETQEQANIFDTKAQLKKQGIVVLNTTVNTIALGLMTGCCLYAFSRFIAPFEEQNLLIKKSHEAFEALKNSGCTDPEKLKLVAGLTDQVSAGVPGAAEKLARLNDLMKEFPVEIHGSITLGGIDVLPDSKIIHIDISNQPDNLIKRILTKLPSSLIKLEDFTTEVQSEFVKEAMGILRN